MNSKEMHIISSVLTGKTECFSYFLDAYGQQIFNLIVRMTGSPEDAEELTQDSFMKAFEHLSSFNGNSSFSTWLYRIAYNTTLSALRKKSRPLTNEYGTQYQIRKPNKPWMLMTKSRYCY